MLLHPVLSSLGCQLFVDIDDLHVAQGHWRIFRSLVLSFHLYESLASLFRKFILLSWTLFLYRSEKVEYQVSVEGVDSVIDKVSRLDIDAEIHPKLEPTTLQQSTIGAIECKCGVPLCICEAPTAKTDPVPMQVCFFYNGFRFLIPYVKVIYLIHYVTDKTFFHIHIPIESKTKENRCYSKE